ncbi:MAG TPA: TlpA disulfide reductase family protein [Stellaceae bacterium]|nr:TlpA disulfide reductase family protein [Stellaceae bacterium]
MGVCRAIVAALVLCASTPGPAARADDPEKVKIGEFILAAPPQPAPEISFTDGSGNTVALADFKGKFVILNLWATWCEPCLKEMPSLAALQARLGPALTVLAVSEDRGGAAVVQPFVDKLGLDRLLKIYLDPKSMAIRAFAARGLPTSVVIDREGKVLGKVEGGANWDSEAMRATLAGLMPPAGDAAKPR